MSNRGIILLAVGMLVLGLVLGLATGGAAGYFAGQSGSRAIVGRAVLPVQQQQPNQAPSQQQTPAAPFQQPAPFPTPRRNQPSQTVVLGAQVEEVIKDGPAEKAGVKVGDVITAVGGTKIDATHSLADLVQAKKPGDKVDLTLTRDGKEMTISVELGKSADNADAAYLGIRYSTTLPGNRKQFPSG